jgi:hypothetical protein
MRADMIEHGDEIGLEGHRIIGRAELVSLGRLVREVMGDHRPLEQLVRRHIVFNQKAEIDDPFVVQHHTLLGCQADLRFFPRNASITAGEPASVAAGP